MAIKFNRSQTFATNGTVTAAGLHNLIDGTDIYQALITDQTNLTSVGSADELLIADADLTAGDAPRAVTVNELFEDALTISTYTNGKFTNLSFTNATGNNTVSTSATITTGTIPNLTAGTTTGTAASFTSGTIPTATFGTTTSTAATITTGTIPTLTIGSTTATAGTITNLTTTLAGDFTISQGTGTLGTTGVTAGTYGGSSAIPTITVDAKGRVTTASTSSITTGYTGFRNRIYNGDFSIAQRATSFVSGANDDDTYNLDRWYVLSDGNDAVDITQETSTVPTNGLYAIALDVETANKKFGIAQIIEQKNCVGLIGGNVTLSFKAKVSATTKLDNVKAAVVAWSGTADTVTSDIISAWGAEGTNPTLIANATYENTPANLNVTTSYATYSMTANVDTANTKNLIVFIWSDVTDTTAGDFLYITDVQLEAGSTATEFERRPHGTELALCQRYYQARSGTEIYANRPFGVSDVAVRINLFLICQMRASPTVSFVGATNFTSGPTASSIISDYVGVGGNVNTGNVGYITGYTASSEL